MRYTIKIVAEAGPCPITGKPLPALQELVTVSAATPADAVRHAQVVMTIRPKGQLLHYYHGSEEIFANLKSRK